MLHWNVSRLIGIGVGIAAICLVAVLIPLIVLLWQVGTDPAVENTLSQLPECVSSMETLTLHVKTLNRDVVPDLTNALHVSQDLVRELKGPADFMVAASEVSLAGFEPLKEWKETTTKFRDQTRPRTERTLGQAVKTVDDFCKGPAVEIDQNLIRLSSFLESADQIGPMLHKRRQILLNLLSAAVVLLGILFLLNGAVLLYNVKIISSIQKQTHKES